MRKSNYIKSPLNYTGGKFKILGQVIPMFPSKIDTFIDVFGGGCNVAVNVDAKNVIYNDINSNVVQLLEYVSAKGVDRCLSEIEEIISYYNLSKENKEGYLSLRTDYNNSDEKNPMMLYMLICHAFNYQIRFNGKGQYNMPFGKDRSSFNPSLQKNFIEFVAKVSESNYQFTNLDFRQLVVESMTAQDFLYVDPPYFNSTATYTEGDGWIEQDERDLLDMLDKANEKGIKFALSNNLKYDNPLLDAWKEKYNVHYIDLDYSNCNYQKKDKSKDIEVLITNYDVETVNEEKEEQYELYNGDCLEVLDELIAEGTLVGKIDACITDPPYNISHKPNNFTSMGRQGIDFGEWDKDADILTYMDKVATLLKPGGAFVIFNDWRNMGVIADYAEQLGLEVKDMVRWEKPNPMPRNKERRYIVDFEVAVWLVKPGASWTFNRQSDGYERAKFVSGRDGGKLHPTQKPVALMEWLVSIHTNLGDIVLDPFNGSGSTGVAALNLGREFIGIERDASYYKTAKDRLDKVVSVQSLKQLESA